MSTTTTNYGLIKPDTTDPILIGQLNDNADAIDAALKENADAIENKPDAADIPTPSTAAPAMDGTASPGTSEEYARADHVHPSDTSRASATAEAEDRAALVELVDGGAKNFLDTYSIEGGRRYGITYTINADGSISTTAGTATQNSNITVTMTLPAGTYYVSGCPDGGNKEEPFNFNASIIVNGDQRCRVTNSTMVSSFTLIETTEVTWRFRVYSGQSIGSTTFYPMVCTKAAWDISHEYQPYRPSYQELYEMVKALQANQ